MCDKEYLEMAKFLDVSGHRPLPEELASSPWSCTKLSLVSGRAGFQRTQVLSGIGYFEKQRQSVTRSELNSVFLCVLVDAAEKAQAGRYQVFSY